MLTSEEYYNNLKKFHKVDGIKAIVLYGIYILILILQGLASTTNLSVSILNKLHIAVPLLLLLVGVIFIVLSKEGLCTVGLNKTSLIQSLLSGAVIALFLVTGMAVYFQAAEKASVGITYPAAASFVIFAIGAIQEEIIFRGYIQTRLIGILRQPPLCSLCTALLFLGIHYPTRWAAGGFSLIHLSPYYVISLIVLHFVCSFVYRKTNCLWGAIVLHFLYNLGQSMLVL